MNFLRIVIEDKLINEQSIQWQIQCYDHCHNQNRLVRKSSIMWQTIETEIFHLLTINKSWHSLEPNPIIKLWVIRGDWFFMEHDSKFIASVSIEIR